MRALVMSFSPVDGSMGSPAYRLLSPTILCVLSSAGMTVGPSHPPTPALGLVHPTSP